LAHLAFRRGHECGASSWASARHALIVTGAARLIAFASIAASVIQTAAGVATELGVRSCRNAP